MDWARILMYAGWAIGGVALIVNGASAWLANRDQKAGELEIARLKLQTEQERLERIRLEERFAPRRLTVDTPEMAKHLLKPFKGQLVQVISYNFDAEAAMLGDQIVEALKASVLRVMDTRMRLTPMSNLLSGIEVEGTNNELAARIVWLLQQNDVTALHVARQPQQAPVWPPSDVPMGKPDVQMLIGTKPLTP